MTQTKVEAPFVENNRPFRNLIINGDMQIAQRGTSQTGVANDASEGYNTLDRFGLYYFGNEGGVATVSQDTTVPSDTTYGKFSKSFKIDVTTADTSLGATGSHAIKQTIESSYIHHSGWDYTSSSSKITLQFWAQSVKAGDYHVLFRCHDASGERYYVAKYTLVANTWKHIEIVVPGNSNLVFNDDNGEGLEVRWNLSAGDDRNDATADTWFAPGSDYDKTTNTQVNFFDSTDNNFFLTGVQLEVGDVASGFEHLPFDVQLARCKRYYERIEYEGMIATMTATSTSNAYARIECEVEKRTDPTVTLPTAGQSTNQTSVLSGSGSYPSTTGSHAVGNPTPLGFRLQATSYDSLETGGGLMLYVNGTVHIEFDAEL
jgi:hypothetical protein